MAATDLIRKRMEKEKQPDKDQEKESKPKARRKAKPLDTSDIQLEELSSRVGDSGLQRLGIESEYEGRKTISASIPAWIKAALDFIALTATKSGQWQYGGFGGKSRFIAEALETKLKKDFPEVYEKLKRAS
ncbi:MAG: hypothetical protein ACFE89_08270 [Candidatus Hodarchaeota archaeon]